MVAGQLVKYLGEKQFDPKQKQLQIDSKIKHNEPGLDWNVDKHIQLDNLTMGRAFLRIKTGGKYKGKTARFGITRFKIWVWKK